MRTLPTETFSVWVLILQLTAYVSYLDFGVQTAVGRFVAYHNDLGNFEERDRIVNTSFAILCGSGLLAILLMFTLVWQLPLIFRTIPNKLLTETKIALLLVGSSLAIGLPFSVFNGVFVGIQRYEIPAIITGAGKLTTAILIVIAAKMNGSLALMGAAIAGVNFISYIVQFLACQRFNQGIKYSYNLVSKNAAKEVFSYCFSLSIGYIGLLLVSGVDTTIIGIFNLRAVAYYSIAASIITLIVGLQSAIFSPILPVAAVMDARSDAKQLGKLLITSTRYGMFMLFVTGIPLILGAKPFLTLWAGQEYAENGAIILQCLVIANIIRLSFVPYVTLVIGTAQQHLVIVSPLLEGFSNLITSLALGSIMGATGVALGTIIGGIVGVTGHISYNMPRTKGIIFSRYTFIKDALLSPSISVIPILLILPAMSFINSSLISGILLITGSISVTLVLIWNFSLLDYERKFIISLAISTVKNVIKL
ncbi:hypothetical protein DSM106972_091220 [Dulcicalothrix desertica PCC 7102]|uniref:Polysaccharide biosynthesis protein C-terminal domain-containing protein n=1 Tax=Dulcicalothrix desertica PCC 7102 TaxID=232991 RepID=A0A3S1IC97_9CYAN|nr:hypothetical protein DSM106972_091220 [Dulcicalothrix desertica PCC 7102]